MCELRGYRILLEEIISGKFMDSVGEWTTERSDARTFDDFLDVMTFAQDQIGFPIGAHCSFQDPSYNFSVYLRAFDPQRAQELDLRAMQVERHRRRGLRRVSSLCERRLAARKWIRLHQHGVPSVGR